VTQRCRTTDMRGTRSCDATAFETVMQSFAQKVFSDFAARLPAPLRRGELPAPSWRGELPALSWRGELPAPSWRGELPALSWRGELPAPLRRGELRATSWRSELRAASWPGELRATSWRSELRAASWPGELPAASRLDQQRIQQTAAAASPPGVRRGYAPPASQPRKWGYAPRSAFGPNRFRASPNQGRSPLFISFGRRGLAPPHTRRRSRNGSS
jgi:hypothetical protein